MGDAPDSLGERLAGRGSAVGPMDTAAIDALWVQLASDRPVRGVKPFIEAPVDTWVRIDPNGVCVGDFATREVARKAREWSVVQNARVTKAQTVRWFSQPMRVKGGPVINRVADIAKYPAGTVYLVGRGRAQFDAVIYEVTPYEGASLKRTLFKGAVVR
jgi:hypothetical protein